MSTRRRSTTTAGDEARSESVREQRSDLATRRSAVSGSGPLPNHQVARALAPRPGADGPAGAVEPPAGGTTLPAGVRRFLEAGLSTDLGRVRLHTDAHAAAAAESLDARAFTIGRHVVFGAGEYDPGSRPGMRLLAHEVTHAVQQGLGPAPSSLAGLPVSSPDWPTEREASTIAARLASGAGSGSTVPSVPAAPGMHRQPAPAALAPSETTTDAADLNADKVWDALNWLNDVEKAVEALSGHGPSARQLLAQRFAARHGMDLASYLRDQLSGDELVLATALLHSSHTHDQHTQLARALIGGGTRDTEVFRILDALPLAGRQELARRYDQAFGAVGSGSLKADLTDDLSGWALEKTLAMLHRELTQADHLYFLSLAISGTHTDSVVSLVQGAWDRGPAAVASLEADWNRYVRNEDRWTEQAWTTMTLDAAMRDELSGEAWELVAAILQRYRQAPGTPGADPTALEDVRLDVARASLRAATAGGYTGVGTHEEQVFRAITEIRTVWQQRLERTAADPELHRRYQAQWDRERTELLAAAPEEMDEGTADQQRLRLLLSGSLTPADEVYLARADLDSDKVVDVVTRAWASGQMGQLIAQAREEKRDGSGQVVRPRVDLLLSVPITSGMPWRRVAALVREDADDAARGAARIKLELDEDDSDGQLRKAYELVAAARSGLGVAALRAFAAQHLSGVQAPTPEKQFLAYITGRYENSYTCYDFQDLLEPASTAGERANRAAGRLTASSTGVLDWVLGGVVGAYDTATGEDTGAVTVESLERLRYIAAHEGASEAELDAMAAMAGVERAALSSLEYDAFKARLDELRALKKSVADALATAVEIVIQAAITIATGGAGGVALAASLASALAGMAMREALLGRDYEFTSDENAQRLVTEIAAAGTGAISGHLLEGVGDIARLGRLGRAELMKEALQEAFKGVGRATAEQAFSNRLPTAEEIAARALTIAGSAAGGGAGTLVGAGAPELRALGERLRANVGSALTNSLISGMSEEAASLVRTGVGDLTGAEITARFARKGGDALVSGFVSGATTTAAQSVRARREAGGTGGGHDGGGGTSGGSGPEPDGLRARLDGLWDEADATVRGHPDAPRLVDALEEAERLLADPRTRPDAARLLDQIDGQVRRMQAMSVDAGDQLLFGGSEEGGLNERPEWNPPAGTPPRPAEGAAPAARLAWLRNRLGLHVRQAMERFAVEGLTPAQLAAVENSPGLGAAFRGSRIDEFAKQTVLLDPDLAEVITAPDFIPEPDFLHSVLPHWFDATTRRDWANHLDRYAERYGRERGRLLATDPQRR